MIINDKNVNIIEHEEESFRNLVLKCHKDGHFRNDPHKMQANFKTRKTCIDMFGVEFSLNENTLGFCGIEIFEYKNNLIGFIHCLGVPKPSRGRGISVELLDVISEKVKEKHPSIVKIMSTCNPISAKSHERAGYIITNPGRLSPSGKLMQIKLEKVF